MIFGDSGVKGVDKSSLQVFSFVVVRVRKDTRLMGIYVLR
jgi:hypothetical protein